MIFLIISICASVAVSVYLKHLRLYSNFSAHQCVAANYPVALGLCFVLLTPDFSSFNFNFSQIFLFLLLGFALPSIFLVFSYSLKHAGIIKSDAAQRLSIIISASAAFFIFKDTVNAQKVTAIFLAFLALILLLIRTDDKNPSDNSWIYLLAVWLGYGFVDILLKQISTYGIATSSYLSISFALAGIISFLYIFICRIKLHFLSLLSGIGLGLLNFCNIYTYIRAHQELKNPAVVFSLMNIGVIIMASIVGLILFREKLSKLNVLGLVLAVISVFLLYRTIG